MNRYALCFQRGRSINQLKNSRRVPPGEPGTAVVNCPSGTVATGGGFGAQPGLVIREYIPEQDNGPPFGYEVNANNPTDLTLRLTVEVICSKTQP